MARFDRFIQTLAGVELSERATNQYSRTFGDLRANAMRRRNLRLYLSEMAEIAPSTLLVGEAVSYRKIRRPPFWWPPSRPRDLEHRVPRAERGARLSHEPSRVTLTQMNVCGTILHVVERSRGQRRCTNSRMTHKTSPATSRARARARLLTHKKWPGRKPELSVRSISR